MTRLRGNWGRQSFDGRGVFVCECCGRRCRQVDQLGSPDWCAQCDELAMMQNGVWDNGPLCDLGKAERDRLIAKLKKAKGDPAKVQAKFPDLWNDGARKYMPAPSA